MTVKISDIIKKKEVVIFVGKLKECVNNCNFHFKNNKDVLAISILILNDLVEIKFEIILYSYRKIFNTS